MIALDTNALSALVVPGASHPIKLAKERLLFLIEETSKANQKLVIPTPVLAEILVKLPPDRIQPLLLELKVSPWFKVESFDQTAAVELGARTAKAIAAKDKWEGLQADHTKIKFDRQIVAIAISVGAAEIISNDKNIVAIGERWGFPVRGVHQLPVPPSLIPPPLLAQLEDEEDGQIASLPATDNRKLLSGGGPEADDE